MKRFIVLAFFISMQGSSSGCGKDEPVHKDGSIHYSDANLQKDAGLDGGFTDGYITDAQADGHIGDAANVDGSTDGQTVTDGGTSLSPDLEVANPSGTPCTTPGGSGECNLGEMCRLYDSAQGRCESCGPCGNLHAQCAASNECDILFMCYKHLCTGLCTLGQPGCAGGESACLNIGHPTLGVCDPFI